MSRDKKFSLMLTKMSKKKLRDCLGQKFGASFKLTRPIVGLIHELAPIVGLIHELALQLLTTPIV